jgi:hypothetical protein
MRGAASLTSLASLLLVGCVDCGDLDRTGGNSAAGFFAANVSAIPVGGVLRFQIRDYEFAEGSDETEVESVRAEPAEQLELLMVAEPGWVTVRGVAEGDPTVSFLGIADDEQLFDNFVVPVRAVGSAEATLCLEQDVAVLEAETLSVPYALFSGQGELLRGREVYPFEVQPPEAATLDPGRTTADVLHYALAARAGASLAIRPTVGRQAALQIQVVNPAAVSSVEVFVDGGEAQVVGTDGPLRIEARAGSKRVCSPLPYTVEARDPSICKLLLRGEVAERLEVTSADEVLLRTLAAGTCRVLVRVLDGAFELEKTVTVSAAPTGGGGGGGGGGGFDFD